MASAAKVVLQSQKEFKQGKAQAENGASNRVAEVQKEARKRVAKVGTIASK